MQAIEISFPDTDSAEAGMLANELRLELARDGIDPGQMRIKREDPGAMDLGSILLIAASALGTAGFAFEVGSKVIDAAHIGMTIYEFCRREHHGVRITTPRGAITIGPGEVELEKLREVLRLAFDGDPEA